MIRDFGKNTFPRDYIILDLLQGILPQNHYNIIIISASNYFTFARIIGC